MELESPATIIPCFEKEIVESLRLAPESSQARVLRSNFVCATQGVGPGALAEVDSALALEPSNARAHFWRAAVLSGLEYHSEAIREVREAVRLEPQSALFHAYVGRVLFYAGEHEETIEKLTDLIRLDPALCVARLWLGLALSHSGRFDRAIEVASEMNPIVNNPVARCYLSYVLARAGYQEDAIRVLQRL